MQCVNCTNFVCDECTINIIKLFARFLFARISREKLYNRNNGEEFSMMIPVCNPRLFHCLRSVLRDSYFRHSTRTNVEIKNESFHNVVSLFIRWITSFMPFVIHLNDIKGKFGTHNTSRSSAEQNLWLSDDVLHFLLTNSKEISLKTKNEHTINPLLKACWFVMLELTLQTGKGSLKLKYFCWKQERTPTGNLRTLLWRWLVNIRMVKSQQIKKVAKRQNTNSNSNSGGR